MNFTYWNCRTLNTFFLIADDVTFEFPVPIPVCCNTAGGNWC